nr:protein SAR DEFICIENT 4 [Ipomoea batatas]
MRRMAEEGDVSWQWRTGDWILAERVEWRWRMREAWVRRGRIVAVEMKTGGGAAIQSMAINGDKVNPPSAAAAVFISTATLRRLLTHASLIRHLHSTLSTTIQSPVRHSHDTSPSSSLLLMPSWSLSPSLPYVGVKLVTYHPNNSAVNLPGVHASYALFSSLTGQTLATMDATDLTLYRTSCISALASKFLSRENSKTLVMVGAGSLAPHLIRAHLAVRPGLKTVIIWNRTIKKAQSLVEKLQKESGFEGVIIESNGNLEEVVGLGDIVSCATNSEAPLVKGGELKEGAHLDMVGSFKPSMMECDDEAIRKGRVFIDNEAALVESGELVGAFERGVITRDDVVGDLVELIKGEKSGRISQEETTVFKSVGSAAVDLLTAQLVYETFMKNQVHG